jgi:hypothetical protein
VLRVTYEKCGQDGRGMKKRKDRTTEISIAFAMVALVAAILIVYFDTAHKLKLLDERIENIEMSGPQTK